MVIASTHSFKILTTCRYLFFLTLIFTIPISTLHIAISSVREGVANNEVGTVFSLIGFYSSN